MPTGHGNSFAHRTLPGLVSVVVRDDQPINLVSAFEAPVRSTNGVAAESTRRLVDELRRATELWGATPLRVASTYTPPAEAPAADTAREVLGPPLPFSELSSAVVEIARQRLAI
jgi:CRISPR system Cascade subunit CasC